MPLSPRDKSMERPPTDTRSAALSALLAVSLDDYKLDAAIRNVSNRARDAVSSFSPLDMAFLRNLVTGTLRHLMRIDEILSDYLTKPLRLQNPVMLGILRLGAYEILYMDRVPDHAAVDEAVRLADLYKLTGLKPVINATLRRIAGDSERGEIGGLFRPEDEIAPWIMAIIKDRYSDSYEDRARALISERGISLRFNLHGVRDNDPAGYIVDLLASEGFETGYVDMGEILRLSHAPAPQGILPTVYELKSGGDIRMSTAFREGLISVQDPSSALVAAYAAPEGTDLIIDVAAAPGGKSTALADMMHGNGYIDARDISSARIKLIENDILRTGFHNIHPRVMDALTPDEDSLYRADIVVADLPCSGLGVLARKPDIRLHTEPHDIEELAKLESDILDVVSKYVRPGGKLVYSTCTLTREENEFNTARLIREYGFTLTSEALIAPSLHNDGFYIAVLRRRY